MDGTLTVEILTSVLPDSVIEQQADETGVVERNRKVDVVVFVWTLILGFPAGAKRTIASLRRRFEEVAAIKIARSSFYDWFSPALVELMRSLVDWCLETRIEQTCKKISGTFEGFRQLLAVDSTVINLHQLLASTWEATNEGAAACKLHVVSNIVDCSPNSVQLTDQRTHDSQPMKRIGSWVQDCLLMGDLAYYDFHLFHRIDQQGGYFVSRAKSNANPRIVSSNQTLPGRAIDITGQKLQDVLCRLERQFIDVTVALEVELRKYRGRSSTKIRHFRLVGRKNEDTGQYHLYFTNVAVDQLGANDIAETYALRWQIELLFKRMKSTLRLHQIPSTKEHIVRALIWASVLAVLCSNALLKFLRRKVPERIFPAERMEAVFRDCAELILWAVVAHRRDGDLRLFDLIVKEAADPNQNRARSHDILEAIPLMNSFDYKVFSINCA